MLLRRLAVPVIALALAISAVPVLADDAPAPGVKGDMIKFIDQAQDELVQLAGAMPAGKYSWRPAKGVRSVAEVYMHVATTNYGIPQMMGAPAPDGFKFETYEKSITDKDAIIKAMTESFASLKTNLMNVSDADMEKEVDLFGMKMSQRAGYLLQLSHVHEHLGQSIAYARVNGIVPPWTAKANAAAAAEEAKKKAKGGTQ